MILASLLLALQAPAAVPADPLAFDLRCLILAAGLHENPDAEVRQAGQVMSYYYFGRVDGRMPEADLSALMLREIAAMEGTDPQPLIQACGREMEVRGQRLVEAGERIEAHQRAAADPGN